MCCIGLLLPIVVNEKPEGNLFGDGTKDLFVDAMEYLFGDGMEYCGADGMEYFL